MQSLLKTSLLLFLFNSILYAKPKEVNFSMVISGGVSLGAYEAGYNWAMIKMLNELKASGKKIKPELRSVAGASAGSINALLSAMYWCQKESIPLRNTIDDNLFFETWVNLGLEDLMIKGENKNNRSTLFSRNKLKEKGRMIINHLKKPIYKKGCSVPLGFSVTKATPMIEEFEGIKIKNQHFSVPFILKEKKGRMTLSNKKMPPSSDFYISIPGVEKDIAKIANILYASSAFPGAFQQIKLKYLYQGKKYSSYFIDGGAYDNIPLQLAIELNKKAKKFIFIDPSNTRKERKTSAQKEKEEIPLGFFNANSTPLLNSVEIFQSMKLYQAINQYFKKNKAYSLVLSSRFHPITGNFLGHFGAFLDKNFRIYDYYVGIYDAIHHLAKEFKKKGHFSYLSQIELMNFLKTTIHIEKNQEAQRAYDLFLQTEFHHKKPKVTDRISAIYTAFNTQLNDKDRYDIPEFKKFLSRLDINYLKQTKHSFLSRAKRDIDHWYKKPLRTIINRITTLENERAKTYPEHETVAKATSIAAWAGSTFVKKKDGFDILPMNTPRDEEKESLLTALRLLPNELATDMYNGGFTVGYSSYWYNDITVINGFEAKFSYNHSENFIDFARADINLFKEYDDFIKFGIGTSFFGDMKGSFYKEESAYGFNTYVDFMDIFRLTYVKRYGDIEDHDYLYFGIENIPSLLYWLNR
jgi:predicted acylesterase/phospholipase RssA